MLTYWELISHGDHYIWSARVHTRIFCMRTTTTAKKRQKFLLENLVLNTNIVTPSFVGVFCFFFLLQHWQYTQIKWRSVCRIHFFHAHMCRYMFIFLFMAEHKKWNQWSTLFHLRASMVQCNHPFLISLYSANDLIVVYFKMDTNGCVYMHINHPHHLPNCHSHCLFYLCCTEIWWWFYFCHGWILFG